MTRTSPNAPKQLPVGDYITAGVLWEAFKASNEGSRTVVLIDEIDKADPDVPNSLLEVLGNGTFKVEETGTTVTANDEALPLVIITTNDERELSRPFRRRCVTLTLRSPGAKRLVEIARHWGLTGGADGDVATQIAGEVEAMAKAHPWRKTNVAEFLDALRVCLKLHIAVGGPEWEAVKRATLLKEIDPEKQDESAGN